MHTLTRKAAVGLLMSLALGGTALAAPGTADAAPHDTAARSTLARPAPPVVVHLTVTQDGLTRSRTGFRPGWTTFTVATRGPGGSVEVARLAPGYTLNMLRKDFKGLFSGDVKAVRRIDRKVDFYGGAPVRKSGTASFATRLDAGRYLVANLDKGTWTWLRVAGAPQARSHPRASGVVNMVPEDRFANPHRNGHSGWMRSTNRTDEPHFVDLGRVKATTTAKKVRAYMASGAKGQPSWALAAMAGTLVVGPGHTVFWSYDVPRGKYLEMCWWPSDTNGMPHAMMGMWHLTWLH